MSWMTNSHSTALHSLPLTVALLPFTTFLLVFLYLFYVHAKLRHIPGPFLASLTNIPRLRWVLTGKAHEVHTGLHRKYGKLVRFGPNMVSVSDPAEIPNIYGFNGKYIKVRKAAERKPSPHVVWQQTVLLTAPQSNFYHVIMPYVKGKVLPGLFATQDENLHRVLKRPIANIYSMSNLLSFEAYVDSTMRVFFDQLDKLFVMTGNVCDLDVWLQLFAFDVMGEITFSKRLGFLERAEDVDGIMASIWAHFYLVAPVSLFTMMF